jgi:hypothetical protein
MRASRRNWKATSFKVSVHKQQPYTVHSTISVHKQQPYTVTQHNISSQTTALRHNTAHPASCTMGTGSFPVVKRPGRGADHPPPHSAEVEHE